MANSASAFSITRLLSAACAVNSDAIAMRHDGRETSWQELSEQVARWAGVLHSLGLKHGERVAVLAANSDYFFTLLLAVPWAGAVLEPLNTRLSSAELADCLEDSGSCFLLSDSTHAEIARELMAQVPGRQRLLFIDGDENTPDTLANLARQTGPIPDQDSCDEDTAVLCYTGGTTGRAKGVILSHRSLVTGALQWQSIVQLNARDCLLIVVPLFHLAGLSNCYGALLVAGTSEIVSGFDPAWLPALIEREQISYALLVPTMIKALVDDPAVTKHDLTSLKKITYGGSPISQENLRSALLRLPTTEFIQIYGQTETAVTAALMPEFHQPSSSKLNSVGRPIATVVLRIVDADGNDAKSGNWGEIYVRSPAVANGYWQRPEESAEAFGDGWLHTGDIGYLDEAGFLYNVDRVKDMIINGGENIYSLEVENVLEQHSGVMECAVIGLASEHWGETVHAVVRVIDDSTLTAEELIAHCSQSLAGYKCPTSIHFRQTALPRSPLGKILKRSLREA